jgi:hypothetical protein
MASLISRLTTQVDDRSPSSQNHGNAGGAASSLYGLDHAILNVPDLRAQTMWINMGYWRVSPFLSIILLLVIWPMPHLTPVFLECLRLEVMTTFALLFNLFISSGYLVETLALLQ